MSEIMDRIAIAFAGWAVLLALFNPFFENKRMRLASVICAALATVAFVFRTVA